MTEAQKKKSTRWNSSSDIFFCWFRLNSKQIESIMNLLVKLSFPPTCLSSFLLSSNPCFLCLLVWRLFQLYFHMSALISFCLFSPPFFSPRMLVSGLLFLLRSAVPSVPAPWLYLLLWHLLIHWSGERQAIGGWYRVAMAAHLQHLQTLDSRFVTRCPSLCPITCPLC